ncbi:MAG: 3-oxo-5-alpha-steroid 4-dehydrogenase [Deltaproteobacteria bacterium]|nr:3-oxo-5-alpha-steroid 4-dehydrogenase [Deltaproteobacteria bacterium]
MAAGKVASLGVRSVAAAAVRDRRASMPRPMEPDRWYFYGLVGLVAAGVASFLALLFVAAPYGRHERPGWGASVPTRIAWVVQELPAPLLFAIVFLRGEHAFRPVPLAFLLLWQMHYLQRTFVYPLRMRVGVSRVPLTTIALAIAFNAVNASLNAYAISHGALRHVESWFADPRFAIGVALFLAGFAVNLQSDAILRRLRKPGETGYEIPRGGLFRFVSSPNYLGEIIEWCGWALATWTWAGAAFAFFTIANLLPRALSHHRWYREKFPDYPRERKAIIPGVL